ncbi:MAG: hypothetical protein DWQ34_15085 [Planctomycetota bacterium]|nr:MAG: hypothetical protein DWQ29_15005 [Planctomycetota bacterium]REJ91480.1 MAG: hypothetical protein DWQ34_15085 [Planctomycetota bacterium]
MGGGQIEQPLLGKEGVAPAMMVAAATRSPRAFAQDGTQSHPQPAVDAGVKCGGDPVGLIFPIAGRVIGCHAWLSGSRLMC